MISWETAGIRIRSSGGMSTGFMAAVCLACDPAACAEACPTGAFSQRKGGGVLVKSKLCIRCGSCAKACPVGAVALGDDGRPYVCIHCGRCVPFCPHDCLELAELGARVTGDAGDPETLTHAMSKGGPEAGGEPSS